MSLVKTSAAPTGISPETAAGVAQFLTPAIMGLTALVVNGKQLHWHVRGENFVSVHELFDTVVANAQDAADSLAERIVALGLPIDNRLSTVASKSTNPEVSDGFLRSNVAVQEAIAQLDSILALLKIAVDELGVIDPPSQDAAIEVVRTLDKDRWFLFSHLSHS